MEEADLSPDERRFVLDLEFLQCLANPGYLKFLAQHESKYFQDEKFIEYLKYLTYFKQPDYARYIVYPHCLFVLDMLQDESFRSSLSNNDVITYFYDQQHMHWNYYRNNRLGLSNNDAPKDV